ncbi:hypothetical protein KDA23_02885 [Candidatus Saccharibacteria bacterium]|nr:hypothetical protein [Candidatus Saccharibacteria bacterium]
MDDQKQQIVEKLKAANNILVTVSSNPSVDQLAACIGLTLMLNKLDKHATAVFSGEIPSTIEFLKPEETIEKNTDSLRDFIIALDKSKADKLRYKVEDKVVKIFITPYRTSLSDKDLNFSQGDFNVDVVLALGVKEQGQLDQAITSHGRILHDATVMCINVTPGGELGSVNWQKPDASSLSELVTEIAKSFEKPLLDGQIATALLTGIVAETDRFRNERTAASTMNASADLMSAGANQQLVAKELEHELDVHDDSQAKTDEKPADEQAPKSEDGTLEIAHGDKSLKDMPDMVLPEPTDQEEVPPIFDEKPTGDSAETLHGHKDEPEPKELEHHDGSRPMITHPPTMGGNLTANIAPDNGDGVSMGLPQEEPKSPILNRDDPAKKEDDELPATLDTTFKKPDEPKPEDKVVESPPEPITPAELPKLTDTPAMPEPVAVPEPPKPEPPQFQESELPKLTDTPPPPLPPLPPQPLKNPQATYSPPPPPPAPAPAPMAPPPPPPMVPSEAPKSDDQTLEQLEKDVESPHLSGDEVQNAREAVMKALSEQSRDNLPPVEALNAQPVDLGKPPEMNQPLPDTPLPPLPPNAPDQLPFANSPADQPMTMPTPSGITMAPPQAAPPTNAPSSNSPPPVPPPMLPPSQ